MTPRRGTLRSDVYLFYERNPLVSGQRPPFLGKIGISDPHPSPSLYDLEPSRVVPRGHVTAPIFFFRPQTRSLRNSFNNFLVPFLFRYHTIQWIQVDLIVGHI